MPGEDGKAHRRLALKRRAATAGVALRVAENVVDGFARADKIAEVYIDGHRRGGVAVPAARNLHGRRAAPADVLRPGCRDLAIRLGLEGDGHDYFPNLQSEGQPITPPNRSAVVLAAFVAPSTTFSLFPGSTSHCANFCNGSSHGLKNLITSPSLATASSIRLLSSDMAAVFASTGSCVPPAADNARSAASRPTSSIPWNLAGRGA